MQTHIELPRLSRRKAIQEMLGFSAAVSLYMLPLGTTGCGVESTDASTTVDFDGRQLMVLDREQINRSMTCAGSIPPGFVHRFAVAIDCTYSVTGNQPCSRLASNSTVEHWTNGGLSPRKIPVKSGDQILIAARPNVELDYTLLIDYT